MYIHVDPWLDALDAHEGPGFETLEALSATIAAAFEETQQMVHVITGSLKASGRVKNQRTEDGWEGTISYGGQAPGMPHPVVSYAKEEFGRGENHDALRNTHAYREDFLNAMTATVRARLK